VLPDAVAFSLVADVREALQAGHAVPPALPRTAAVAALAGLTADAAVRCVPAPSPCRLAD
jgi:hypothetical protein